MSYKGRRQGSYGDDRRSRHPMPYSKRTARRDVDMLPRYGSQSSQPVPEHTNQEQSQAQDSVNREEQPELWVRVAQTLTHPNFAAKISPSLDPEKDAVILSKMAKRKPELVVIEPKTKKVVKRFMVQKAENSDAEADPIDLETINNDQVKGYIRELETQLKQMGCVLAVVGD